MIGITGRLPALPRAVWLLGLTSLLMDASSEIVHAIVPLLLIGPLGASNLIVGLIDGAVEGAASLTKIYSGMLSDRMGSRKRLATAGYGLSALSKLVFPLASAPLLVFLGRFADRLGKGIRGAPRDALIVDWTPSAHVGFAFGVRQGLDTIGAVLGPGFAILLLWFHSGNYQSVLWWAMLPAIASVGVIGFGVVDGPGISPAPKDDAARQRRFSGLRLGAGFWLMMALLAPLLAARCSEAFLILRAADQGVGVQWTPLALVVMNFVAAPVTPIAGYLSDRVGRQALILAGFAALGASHAMLSFAQGPNDVWLASGFWGLHLGLTQGVLSALVADHAPSDRRGAAFGAFHLTAGLAILLGSGFMGWGWDSIGPAASHALAGASILLFLPLFMFAARR